MSKLQMEMDDTTLREKYAQAHWCFKLQLLGRQTVNKFCILCFEDRDEDHDQELQVRSHLIPDSVLRMFPKNIFINELAGDQISIRDFSYKAFCKYRNNRQSCEDMLSTLGECTFKSHFKPFVENLTDETERTINDSKVYHCFVSIGWRTLALTEIATKNSDNGKLVRSCLEYLRAFLPTPQINIDDHFAVYLSVAGKATCEAWCRLMNTKDIGPLIGTVCFGLTPQVSNSFMRWEVQMGPLLVKYFYCDTHRVDDIQIPPFYSQGFSRIPRTGSFTIPGYSQRPAISDTILEEISKMSILGYTAGQRTQPSHWLQNRDKVLLLVSPEFGRYDPSRKVLTPIAPNTGEWIKLHEQNNASSELKTLMLFKRGPHIYLFAQQKIDGLVIFSMSRVIRTVDEKYASLKPSENHMVWYETYASKLLEYLRNNDPLTDEQLPLPQVQRINVADYEQVLADDNGEDAWFNVFNTE